MVQFFNQKGALSSLEIYIEHRNVIKYLASKKLYKDKKKDLNAASPSRTSCLKIVDTQVPKNDGYPDAHFWIGHKGSAISRSQILERVTYPIIDTNPDRRFLQV